MSGSSPGDKCTPFIHRMGTEVVSVVEASPQCPASGLNSDLRGSCLIMRLILPVSTQAASCQEFDTILCELLSANIDAKIQPREQGILATLKWLYRSKGLRWCW